MSWRRSATALARSCRNTLKIVDPATGAVVPRGERGEIAVKGPTLMLGYCRRPDRRDARSGGLFHTGDGGHSTSLACCMEGRLSDIIKTGGANVPARGDAVLNTYPGIKIAQTVGVPHETLGEMVVACAFRRGRRTRRGARPQFLNAVASYKYAPVLLFRKKTLADGSAKVRSGALRYLAAKRLGDVATPSAGSGAAGA